MKAAPSSQARCVASPLDDRDAKRGERIMVRHFVNLFHLSPAEAIELLDRAEARKGDRTPLLAGSTLGLLFEKPSLRTRVSFEAAISHLGGNAIFLSAKDVGLGVRET